MLSRLKPGRELTRAFDERLLARYYETSKQGSRQNLSNGDPLSTPFEPIRRGIAKVMRGPEMALYTRGGGPKAYRDKVLPYCEDMNISPSGTTLSHENITFGVGSTHLYSTVLRILADKAVQTHPGKKPVLLMPAPTYGIFTMQPADNGFDIETFELQEKNGWQIEPSVLARRIREINAEEGRFVAALYHANPHNPSGAVADGEKTQQISRVLKKNNVFAIDDMAYAGIEHATKAVPLASHDFENSVTLFTLSKAYCLPRARSAVACGPQWLIEEIDSHIDRSMISLPASVFAAAAECFSQEHKAEREEQYLPLNSEIYQQHYQVMKAMIDGVDNVDGLTKARRLEIIEAATKAYGSRPAALQALKGTQHLRIMNDNPQAGYFAMVQVRGIDDLFYGTERLGNSFQLATAAIDVGKVLTLPMKLTLAGDSCRDGLRLSFGGMHEKTVVKGLKGLIDTIETLPHKPDAVQQEALEKSGKALSPELVY